MPLDFFTLMTVMAANLFMISAALPLIMGRDVSRAPVDWAEARRTDPAMLSEWQVYRMLDVPRGAWTAFQFLVRERLRAEGVEVEPDGSLGGAG